MTVNQNCETCRWGPRQINCLRPHCNYEVIKNGEMIRRLKDEQLADFLANHPLSANKNFWEEWINKDVDNEFLRRFFNVE